MKVPRFQRKVPPTCLDVKVWKLKVPPDVFKAPDRGSKWCFRFMFGAFTFDRGLRFWSGLLVLFCSGRYRFVAGNLKFWDCSFHPHGWDLQPTEGLLHLNGLFIILGVGVDDAFVIMDWSLGWDPAVAVQVNGVTCILCTPPMYPIEQLEKPKRSGWASFPILKNGARGV